MVHINDLDPEVLYRILYLASGELTENIDEWKEKLTLLQVCTKWYNLFKSYVFPQGFVDIYPVDYKGFKKVNLNSCVYYADNVFVCRSNLGIITGRDKHNCSCVSKLKVIIYLDINIGQCSHVLKELLTLGVGYWLNLSSLSFFTYSNFDNSFLSKEISLEEISATASKYIHDFQNRLPNITYLNVNLNDVPLKTALYILIGHYAPRLQCLHFNVSFKFPLPSFSTELTSLSMDLSDYTHRHPSFCAKSLQNLKLKNISSSDFSWWIFHDFTMPGRIEFTNLKTLVLLYKYQTNEERELSEKYSKQARPYGSHMLQFPKLENLTLVDSPVDCDVLFTDTIPSHLEELIIGNSCDSIVAASRLQFTSVNKLHIVLFGGKTLTNAFYIAADRYFGYTKIGGTCTANIDLFIDVQRTVSWVNITEIRLQTINFNELLKLIPNLYNLRRLILYHIHLSDECLSIILLGLEEEDQGEIELLDTRIKCLTLKDVESGNPHSVLAVLNHLLLRTPTLKEIEIDNTYSYSTFVEKSFLPTKFLNVRFTYYSSYGIF